jgi:uncharacterized protein with HEPN domain
VSFTPHDQEIIVDIVLAARGVLAFTGEVDEQAFSEDHKTQAATIHELLVMGEAAKRLSATFRAQHSEIDWRGMGGMRDKLIHDYRRVNMHLVWEVATQEVPEILAHLESLVSQEDA